MSIDVIILAAGKGARFMSRTPKVLHPLGERPLITYALELATRLTVKPPVIVVAPESEAALRALSGERARYIVQQEPLGTAHAVLQTQSLLKDQAEHILVLCADMPFVQEATVQQMMARHITQQAAMTFLTTENHTHAMTDGGIGLFATAALWSWLPPLKPNSHSGEYELSDLVGPATVARQTVATFKVPDPTELINIDTRVELAAAEAILQQRVNERWMRAGVTIVDPANTYIGPEVTIGQDTVIEPHTHLRGKTSIGSECRIGPNSILESCTIGDRCVVLASVLEYAVMEEDSNIGPFSHLRKGARLCRGAHMGNFGEMKNSTLGPYSKMGHFSYLGDAQIGENVNIGAGTITCNFDGERKHPTVVEDDVFIGSDSLLIAPVRIGTGAKTGAGSVVTHDIPPHSVAYGVPARVRKQLEPETPEQAKDESRP